MTPRGTNASPASGRAWPLILRVALACVALALFAYPARADRLHLSNGAVIEVDEVWEDAEGVWFRRGAVTQVIDKSRVRRIERSLGAKADSHPKSEPAVNKKPEKADAVPAVRPVWIHLVGGAKVQADEADETSEGVWYKRAQLSVFIDKSRVERIEVAALTAEAGAPASLKGDRGWTTGSARLDDLIRQSGARYGVDPYLIFCVMEHESHFRTRAVSHAGAKGLMQLMPGTAKRFGVRNVFDPAQNVMGGTRYLKELLGMFGGRVDLALASYNAGEGAVARYGGRVPPYRETRNYVKLIGARYGRVTVPSAAEPAEAAKP